MIVLYSVMDFECFYEVHEDLLLGLLALNDIRVSLSIISFLNVVNLDVTIGVAVERAECTFNKGLAVIVHLSTDCHKELVYVQGSVTIDIEHVEECGNILFIDSHTEIAAHLCKFVLRNRLAAIIIHNCEELLETNNSTGAPRLDLITEELNKLLRVRVIGGSNRRIGLESADLAWRILVSAL